MKTLSIVLALTWSLAGCGTAYRNNAAEFARTQPESAWGMKPPQGHQKAEMDWLRAQLKDPYSADIQPGVVGRFVLPASFTDPTIVPVWGSSIRVNAKNSFGAYTGFKTWNFYYSKGSLFVVEDGEGLKRWIGAGDSGLGLQRAVNDLRR